MRRLARALLMAVARRGAPPGLTAFEWASEVRGEAISGPGLCRLRTARPGTRTAKMKKSAVLIVDEDRSVCEPLANALRGEGYEALLAHNGVEAFRLYRQCRPDLALLALNMRRQSGWEILDTLSPPDPLTRPLIVISGFADQLGLAVGALLTKRPRSPLAALAAQAMPRAVGEPAPQRRSWRRYGTLTQTTKRQTIC
jgi:CheY-like chemotaxis protein